MDLRRRLLLRGRVNEARTSAPSALPRPPWALPDEADFTARCTRCGDCVGACPRQVLRAGDGGFPETDFRQRGCDFCGDCRRACPTGAIRPPEAPPGRHAAAAESPAAHDPGGAFRLRVQVATACLTARGVECRICAEQCDARALRFAPAPGGVYRLRIDPAACTGCGECLAPCPVGALSLALPRPEGAS